MNNMNNANVDIAKWVPIDMKVANAIARRVRARKIPVVEKVERLADKIEIHPTEYGPSWDERFVQLRFTMSGGRQIVKKFGMYPEGKAAALAMRSPVVVGMTEAELERFNCMFRMEYGAEYQKACEEAKDRAEYERLRKKFG